MIKWKEEFSVNNEEIDSQHKRLFNICSEVFDIASLNDSCDHYDEIINVLEELKQYTVYHFNFEEKLLREYGYSEIENQEFEHVFFVKKLEKLLNKDIDRNQNESAIEISTFVTDWISSHILKSDVKYKLFLSEKDTSLNKR